jgi:hypothetical protein
MAQALEDWPIVLLPDPSHLDDSVQVSFVIGHRGTDRLPHLLLTLQSIAAQSAVNFECVVVEQSQVPEIKEYLPDWVRYVHTPLPKPDMPYCRAWAFNIGVREARGELLVLHDNDMLVPQAYGSEILSIYRKGYEVINLKRFIFYLTQQHSSNLFEEGRLSFDTAPEAVVQNLEAGGSVAISRAAYFAIGGFDESFVGWGGEDNEFWGRAQTRNLWSYGYLPLVHLWHEPQPEKFDRNRRTADLLEQRSSIPAEQRIAELKERNLGELSRVTS